MSHFSDKVFIQISVVFPKSQKILSPFGDRYPGKSYNES
jgi:hypothetical protein